MESLHFHILHIDVFFGFLPYLPSILANYLYLFVCFFFLFQYSVPRGYPILNKLPQMQTVEKGRNAVFHCNASGDPEPVIIWFKDGLPIDQKSNPRYRITELGSLVITLATEKDSAEYMCAAQNDKGIAYSGAVQLYVQGKFPYFLFLFLYY